MNTQTPLDNLELWNKVSKPESWALKAIQAGRLKGKTDINPQWRYKAMTEVFGPIGFGWKYVIEDRWTEPGANGETMCFQKVSVYFKVGGAWSDAIPGLGGSTLVAKESSGMHNNDEGFKMALTDALSVALKMIGVGAEVYMGLWDGAKYSDTENKGRTGQKSPGEQKKQPTALELAITGAKQKIVTALKSKGYENADAASLLGEQLVVLNTAKDANKVAEALNACLAIITKAMPKGTQDLKQKLAEAKQEPAAQ